MFAETGNQSKWRATEGLRTALSCLFVFVVLASVASGFAHLHRASVLTGITAGTATLRDAQQADDLVRYQRHSSRSASLSQPVSSSYCGNGEPRRTRRCSDERAHATDRDGVSAGGSYRSQISSSRCSSCRTSGGVPIPTSPLRMGGDRARRSSAGGGPHLSSPGWPLAEPTQRTQTPCRICDPRTTTRHSPSRCSPSQQSSPSPSCAASQPGRSRCVGGSPTQT